MVKTLLIGAVLLAAAAPLSGQSLADVARAEEARRKTVKGQVKVYTNETLGLPDSTEPVPAPSQAQGAPTTPAPGTTAKPASGQESSAAADTAKDEKSWRDRLATLRDAIKRSQAFIDALQSQINGLYSEFVNKDDPAQRAVIEQKRLAAIAEQDRVKAELAKQVKALADAEDEARKANVPPGWLR